MQLGFRGLPTATGPVWRSVLSDIELYVNSCAGRTGVSSISFSSGSAEVEACWEEATVAPTLPGAPSPVALLRLVHWGGTS